MMVRLSSLNPTKHNYYEDVLTSNRTPRTFGNMSLAIACILEYKLAYTQLVYTPNL